MAPFADFHLDVEQRLGRAVFTHELGSGPIWSEIKAAYKDDFEALATEPPTDEPDPYAGHQGGLEAQAAAEHHASQEKPSA